MIACNGPVIIGDGALQNFISSSNNIHNVYINIFKNPAVTTSPYRQTVVFSSNLKMHKGTPQSNFGFNFSNWIVSGLIFLTFIEGSSSNNDVDLFFNQVRVIDQSHSTWFIQTNITSASPYFLYNIYAQFVCCTGLKIDVYDDWWVPNFNILEITNSSFSGISSCNILGKIIDSVLSGGISFVSIISGSSSLSKYTSGVYNTLCKSGFVFKSISTQNTLFIDNQTYVKSGNVINRFKSPFNVIN